MNDKQALKDLLNDLDRSVNQLSWHGLHEYAHRLETLIEELEKDLLENGYTF